MSYLLYCIFRSPAEAIPGNTSGRGRETGVLAGPEWFERWAFGAC